MSENTHIALTPERQALRDPLTTAEFGPDRREGQVFCLFRQHKARGQVKLRLGRDFVLNGELAERLGAVEGISRISLAPLKKRSNLRLVA